MATSTGGAKTGSNQSSPVNSSGLPTNPSKAQNTALSNSVLVDRGKYVPSAKIVLPARSLSLLTGGTVHQAPASHLQKAQPIFTPSLVDRGKHPSVLATRPQTQSLSISTGSITHHGPPALTNVRVVTVRDVAKVLHASAAVEEIGHYLAKSQNSQHPPNGAALKERIDQRAKSKIDKFTHHLANNGSTHSETYFKKQSADAKISLARFQEQSKVDQNVAALAAMDEEFFEKIEFACDVIMVALPLGEFIMTGTAAAAEVVAASKFKHAFVSAVAEAAPGFSLATGENYAKYVEGGVKDYRGFIMAELKEFGWSAAGVAGEVVVNKATAKATTYLEKQLGALAENLPPSTLKGFEAVRGRLYRLALRPAGHIVANLSREVLTPKGIVTSLIFVGHDLRGLKESYGEDRERHKYLKKDVYAGSSLRRG
jgi:hypothetical protein